PWRKPEFHELGTRDRVHYSGSLAVVRYRAVRTLFVHIRDHGRTRKAGTLMVPLPDSRPVTLTFTAWGLAGRCQRSLTLQGRAVERHLPRPVRERPFAQEPRVHTPGSREEQRPVSSSYLDQQLACDHLQPEATGKHYPVEVLIPEPDQPPEQPTDHGLQGLLNA
ncbi:MAG: hypothetical protein KDB95_11005, partial [Flavobacteriales bacterium]|nr:hypothetical protein [Flavobacteriales bacterium]